MSGYINFRTEFPGPKSRGILERKKQYVSDAIGIHVPVAIAEGKGALVTDVDGNTYIDLTGGLGVLNVGHSPPEVVAAIREQAGLYLHTDFSVVMYESYVELAERLAKLAPGDSPKKCAFFNAGAEAIENCVKIARVYTRKKGIISFEGAFHGRTMMAMTLTSKVKPYKEGFGPFAPEVYRVPYAYCYRCPYNLAYPSCELECASALERYFVTHVSAGDVAAMVIEPVLGEGGFIVPPREFLPRVREICSRHDILLITDEIQTGFGRTGKLFAAEHFGVEADLMAVAKSLAAGLPLSGVVGKREVMDAPGDSAIGGTYVGNPVACVAALKVLDILEQHRLVERAQVIGGRMLERFRAMADRFAVIGDVRGLGAMVGIELVKDRRTKEPAPELTARLLRRAMEKGVLVVKCGVYANVLRVLVTLAITDDQLEEALDVLERCMDEEVKGG